MIRNGKVTGKAMSMPTGVLTGVGVSGGITLIGILLTAWFIDTETIAEGSVGYAAMIILVLASVAGALTASSLTKRRRLVSCMITGMIYLLTLMGITAFFFGGQYQGLLPTVILVIGSCLGAALIGNRQEGNRTSLRHKR